jgi:hypothetical protein
MATGVGAIAVRGLSVAETVAVTESSVDAIAEREVGRYLAKNPEIAQEVRQVRLVAGPKGTVLGRGLKAGQSTGAGTGFHSW